MVALNWTIGGKIVMNHTQNPAILVKKLNNQYIIASSVFALLIISGYWLIQSELYQHSDDTLIINTAQKQLMQTEKLGKTALLIQFTNQPQQRAEYVAEFQQLWNVWKQSHQQLQLGHTQISLPDKNRAVVTQLLTELQPHDDALNVAAQKLFATAQQPNAFLENSSELSGLIQKLLTEQKAFVQIMTLIMSEYESEPKAHLKKIQWLMTLIAMILLMVLLFQTQYIFRPAVQQIQQRLQDIRQNTLLETALDNTSSLISMKDIQGRYLFINRAFEKRLPANQADIAGKNDYDLFSAEIAKQFQAHDNKAVETASAVEVEEILPLDDGLHTYLTVKFPVYDETGNLYAVCGVSTDITERKQTEQALQDSEAMLESFLNAIPESAFLIDKNRIILAANKTGAQRLKVPREKVIGHSIQKLLPADVFEKRNQYLDKVFESGHCIHFEDWRDDWCFHNVICPIATFSNHAIAKVAMVAIDITQYKKIQTELNQLTKELEERVFQRTRQLETVNQELQAEILVRQQTEMALTASEERYRRIVDTAQEGIWLIDARIKITFVNQSLANMLGYQIDDMLNRSLFDFMDETACLEAKQYFEQRRLGIKEKHDFRFQSKTGSELWTIVSTTPLFNEQREFTGALGMIVDITERKRMEEKLRSSEELHRVILSSISDGVFITDDHGQFTYLCPNLEHFAGFTLQEMQEIGNISKLLPNDCICFEKIKNVTEIQNIECQMRNKSGQLLSLLVNVKRVSIKEGTVLYSCRDITERKQAEQNFKQLVENAPDAMVIVNQQGSIVFANAQTEKLFGYARTDLVGKPINLLIPERYRDRHTHHWDNYFNNPCSRSMGIGMELYAVREDGSEFPVEISLNPIETPEGLLVSSSIRDFSERKQVETTLRTIVEGVSTKVGTNFLQQLVEYLAELLQVKYALIGQLLANDSKTLKVLFMVADTPSMTLSEYNLRNTPCEQVITGKVPCCSHSEGIQQQFSNPFLVQMGIDSCVGTPLFDADGRVNGLIAIMDDKPLVKIKQIESLLQIFAARASSELERIQALDALEQERACLAQRVEERTSELTIANMKLARAARLKDEFLANMSHELRTPLNAILGISEVLQDEVYGPINKQQAKSIRTIEDSGRHLLSLINDILDLAKMEAGQVKLEIIPISADGMVYTCLRLVKQLAIKKRIKLSTSFDINVTIVQADERYLKQMLLNLLSNAIKFTPEQGQVNLEIRGHLKQGMVEFIVSDTGIGIAEKDMEDLFKPFVQLDGSLSRAQEGTGLGLSLVSRLAEMHGGSVSVESEVSQGSRFTISLPWQHKMDDPQSNKNTDTELDKAAKVQHPSAVILLVDDNPSVIETVSDYLQTKGYRVITASDGVQAIDKAREVKPDLILMDIQMPVMDGLEAIHRIRADSQMEKIPIIALTALAMPGDKERCFKAGANDYLSKPVSFKGLIAAIEKLL
jgi:PAS domain S-box-containing protein